MAPSLCLRCTDKNAVKKVKNILEKENLLNKQRRILQVDNVGFFLPVLTSTCDNGFNEDCMYGDCCFQFDGFRINVIYVFQALALPTGCEPYRSALSWCLYDVPASKVQLAVKDVDPMTLVAKWMTLQLPNDTFTIHTGGHLPSSPPHSENTLALLLPHKWERYLDIVLFSDSAFTDTSWHHFFSLVGASEFFAYVAKCFRVSHVARKSRIPNDDILRRPHLEWLHRPYSENEELFWTSVVQNSITYIWAPEKTTWMIILVRMFCAGNITEKQRIAHGLPQSTLEEVVLDLYAGIGYFVFPYILYRPTRLLYACEWNPYSVEALERGLQHNAIPFIRLTSPTQPFNNQFKHDNEIRVRNELVDGDVKVVVCPGDNATYVSLYECKVDRVNLGLLPHSDDGWPLAVRALKPSGGYLHVHVNLKKGEEAVFQERLVAAVMELLGCWKQGVWWVRVLHMECVKSFAPRVYHWVADVECRPVDGQRAKVSGQE